MNLSQRQFLDHTTQPMKWRNLFSSYFVLIISFILLSHCQPPPKGADDQRRDPPSPTIPPPSSEPPTPPQEPGPIPPLHYQACSFNVQFIGQSKKRLNELLAHYLAENECDLVLIQELIAPPDLRKLPNSPFFGQNSVATYPDGTPHRPNEESTKFFLAMYQAGFNGYWLSPEDTGPSAKNQNNSTATEWHVVFFKTSKFTIAPHLPQGYLDYPVAQHPVYPRVPYAFAFQDLTQRVDLVFINVHLQPGSAPADRRKRSEELRQIRAWIKDQYALSSERDYIIVGDMNIENAEELAELENNILEDFRSLNIQASHMTNTNVRSPKPYDHVLIHPLHTKEIALEKNFFVLNLSEFMQPRWPFPELPFPGSPYHHDTFRQYFSDHNAIKFHIVVPHSDDD
ncbi:MAG: hypothetical protein NZ480_07810 [Bdellovibrionaceae bacterium]|nr:hypothetical protein [Pseudobdellovibrionaceae bacterium]MDW8189507.1 hypothetical protein [Pseudobdellovibrionaceae bacterium]